MTLLEDRLQEAVQERKAAPDSRTFVRAFARERVLRRQLEERDFSTQQREKMAKKGQAMPGGGYPIENEGDLDNAIQSFGRAKNPAATKAHIIAQAKKLKLTAKLPPDWNVGS